MTGQNTGRNTGIKNLLPPWQKGRSGNPGGRPKGLMEYVRAQTQDGQEIVNLLLRIMRGEPWRGKRPTIDHQIAAAKELLNRGWGRVPEAEEGETRTFTLVVKPGDDF